MISNPLKPNNPIISKSITIIPDRSPCDQDESNTCNKRVLVVVVVRWPIAQSLGVSSGFGRNIETLACQSSLCPTLMLNKISHSSPRCMNWKFVYPIVHQQCSVTTTCTPTNSDTHFWKIAPPPSAENCLWTLEIRLCSRPLEKAYTCLRVQCARMLLGVYEGLKV